jgi:hypothetical protein
LTDNKYLALANIRLKMTKKINKKNGKLKLFYVVATLSETAFFYFAGSEVVCKGQIQIWGFKKSKSRSLNGGCSENPKLCVRKIKSY